MTRRHTETGVTLEDQGVGLRVGCSRVDGVKSFPDSSLRKTEEGRRVKVPRLLQDEEAKSSYQRDMWVVSVHLTLVSLRFRVFPLRQIYLSPLGGTPLTVIQSNFGFTSVCKLVHLTKKKERMTKTGSPSAPENNRSLSFHL